MALRAANGLLDGVTALLVLLAVVWSGYALWDNSRVYAAADNVQAGLALAVQSWTVCFPLCQQVLFPL